MASGRGKTTPTLKRFWSLAGKGRSLYISAALKHYIEYGDKIDNIVNGTKEILSILKSGVLNIEK